MKKLLSLFGAIGLVATSSATVVACGDKDVDTKDVTLKFEDGNFDSQVMALLGVENSTDTSYDINFFSNSGDGVAYINAFNDKDEAAFATAMEKIIDESDMEDTGTYYYVAESITASGDTGSMDLVSKGAVNFEHAA